MQVHSVLPSLLYLLFNIVLLFHFFSFWNFRHVEYWNVPKMILLKQLLKPTRGFWLKRTGG